MNSAHTRRQARHPSSDLALPATSGGTIFAQSSPASPGTSSAHPPAATRKRVCPKTNPPPPIRDHCAHCGWVTRRGQGCAHCGWATRRGQGPGVISGPLRSAHTATTAPGPRRAGVRRRAMARSGTVRTDPAAYPLWNLAWAHPPTARARRVSTAVSNGRALRCTWASRSPPWSVASRVVARSSGSMPDGSFPSA